MAKGERIEKFLEGRVSESDGNKYYKALIPLDDVRKRNAECIRRNLEAWKENKIMTRQNTGFFVPLSAVAVVDIESTGLTYNDPLFLIGVGRHDSRKDVFLYEGFFARDYYEEESTLRAFEKRIAEFSCILSFNGTFDLSRLSERFKNIFVDWKWPAEKHLDVMWALEPYRISQGLENAKLATYEVALLNFKRPDDDVAGEDIPKVYEEYRRGGDPEPLARIVQHNVFDVFSTAALYITLLRNPGYFSQSALDKLKL